MRPTIKYISFYDFPDSEVHRSYSLAATNKMDYIIDTLVKTGYDVEVVSASACTERGRLRWYKGKIESRQPHVKVRFFSSFRSAGKVWSLLRLIWSLLQLFVYLLRQVKKNESILVYHSLCYYNIILIAQKIKRFKVILEVEEIYQDVSPMSKYLRRLEYRMIGLADKFIFSTDLLNEKVNIGDKPYVVVYGTYRSEPYLSDRFDDDKIHVVYAGTLDPRKGGTVAVNMASHLTPEYRVHILGFGREEEIRAIKSMCVEVTNRGGASVTYDGLLKGEAYIEFLQKCQIGLSTQNPLAKFNNTSFPSKILSYMSNGLQVVSVDIDAIRRSPVSEYIYFYREQTPEDIARTILNIDWNSPFDTRAVVQNLDYRFVEQMRSFLDDKTRQHKKQICRE